MNKNHFYWIISLIFSLGFFLGSMFIVLNVSNMIQNYPVIGCIYEMDDALNIDYNKMPFTFESQRELIQKKCGREHIKYNISDEDILIYKGE